MKKIVFILVLLLGVSLSDGYAEHNKGNKQKESELYKKACDGGYVRGCYILGLLYDIGDGVKQNKQKAKELYGKACDRGLNSGCESYKFLNEQGY
ncbi:MAG: sel1 repeat family protein [Sulfurospirillum sp.]|nr:sel1 repeat family protein [Sulfurospirillum sp.]